MRNHLFKKLVLLTMVGWLTGACATSHKPVPSFAPVDVNAEGHLMNAEHVVIVLDASSSMAEGYGKYRKFDIATATVRNLIQTLPDNFPVQSALRSFGHDPAFTADHTIAVRKMAEFNDAEMVSSMATIPGPGGTSPLGEAIVAVAGDLNGMDGSSALIVISDGKDLGDTPEVAARSLKAELKGSLCIYPILVGNDPNGKKLMQKLALIGECGFATNADQLTDAEKMAGFVNTIFIGDAMDSDGDGVVDLDDRCANTPAGIDVDFAGCPVDSDGDGVQDALDQCPGTPANTKVDATGCSQTVLTSGAAAWTFNEISFDVGKADISPDSFPLLDEIAVALIARPALKIEVEGHTDNTGSRAFNMDLSQQRAQAVADYLVAKGVSTSRISAKGYGPDRPIVDNATKQGRSKNRRVQFTKINE